jgi:hypothetical protein
MFFILINSYLDIGIEETNAGIGIPSSIISVRYWTKKLPDCLGLVRYRTIPSIVSFFLPVPDYSDARQSGIPAFIHMNTHTNTHMNMHTNKYTNMHSHMHTDL